jgi:hypothetical protein
MRAVLMGEECPTKVRVVPGISANNFSIFSSKIFSISPGIPPFKHSRQGVVFTKEPIDKAYMVHFAKGLGGNRNGASGFAKEIGDL